MLHTQPKNAKDNVQVVNGAAREGLTRRNTPSSAQAEGATYASARVSAGGVAAPASQTTFLNAPLAPLLKQQQPQQPRPQQQQPQGSNKAAFEKYMEEQRKYEAEKARYEKEMADYNERALAYNAQITEAVQTADSEHGHFVIKPGTMIDFAPPYTSGRYKTIQLLGHGTYGKVVLCEDKKYNNTLVAVKLVRKSPPIYKQAALNEIRILHEVDGHPGCVKLLRDFEHDGHVCMTFELLGENIWANVCRNRKGMHLSRVRDIAFQLLQAVEATHKKTIIHSDIKSENVLVASNPAHPGPLFVKLVDFGCSLFESAWHPPIAGTMNYRAPESVIQAEWSYPVDLWAVGVVLLEMLAGRQLFALSHDDVHLHMMEKLLGKKIPHEVLARGWTSSSQRGLLVMGQGGTFQVAACRPEGLQCIAQTPTVEEAVLQGKSKTKARKLCIDLIFKLMEYDASKRITASEALQHPFFKHQIPYPEQEQELRKMRRIMIIAGIIICSMLFWILVAFFPQVFWWRHHMVSKAPLPETAGRGLGMPKGSIGSMREGLADTAFSESLAGRVNRDET